MAELNLSAAIVGPQAAQPASPRGNDAGSAADDAGSPFSAVMSQAVADGAAAPVETPAAPTAVDGQKGHASGRGAQKDKRVASEIADARDTSRGRGRLLESTGKDKDAKAAADDIAATADGNQGAASADSAVATDAALLPLPATAAPIVAVPVVAANAAATGEQGGSDPTGAIGKHGRRAQSSRADRSAADPAHGMPEPGAPHDPASPRAAHEQTAPYAIDRAAGKDTDARPGDRPAHGHDEMRTALPASANALQAAARDRLNEDFQQRFERALTVAAATHRSADEAGRTHAATPQAWAAAPVPAPTQDSAVQITIPTPVGVAAFTEDFSNRVALLTHGKVHSAELSLTPADLGPVRVSIEVQGTEAKLVFGATHAATRSAIEEALPRLREMLDAQGLQLTDARVGTHSGHGSSRDREPSPRRDAPAAIGAVDAISASVSPAAVPSAAVRSLRLIDVIA